VIDRLFQMFYDTSSYAETYIQSHEVGNYHGLL